VTVLLDANVLIALLVEDHVHHEAAESWFVGMGGNFATCPITQGSLMRLLIREGQTAVAAPPPTRGTNSGLTMSRTPKCQPGESSATAR
jgi:predicted nucleic acid-binding protein